MLSLIPGEEQIYLNSNFIERSDGQSLDFVGLYLPRPVFSHGQLYVAISRVKSKAGLKILICDDASEANETTTNVVFKEIFNNV
ncbi:hypothetical protein P8452_33061 [Trifolium repens]|nr:hypothetical protein P8452_33061 [Trifolium repens]